MTTVQGLRRARHSAEWQSFAATVAVAVVAIVAGLAFLVAGDQAGRRVEQGGINADVPSGWIVTQPVGDLLFSAYDPLEPDRRYTVSAISGAGTPEDAARSRLAQRRALLPGFTIVEDGPGSIADTTTHRLRYTFAAPGASSRLIMAREDYLTAGDRVLVLGLEAPTADFSADEAAFDAFARRVVAEHATGAAGQPVAGSDSSTTLVASIGGGGVPPRVAPTDDADLVAATVQIFGLRVANDPTSAFGWGSGTIISADGLILTNAHVAKPSAAGLGVQGIDPTPAIDPAGLVVAVVEDEAEPAVPRYFATVVATDGYLDAALIRIDRTIDGATVAPATLRLPFLPLGDSEALGVGDPLTVVGFPGIGGNTISLSSGRLSGFLGDPRIGARAWIKTDAVVSQGNSGGLAANEAGELVGLPTMANPEDTGGFSLIRPLALIRPMVDDALAGRPSFDSRYAVASSGSERFTFDTWTTSAPSECVASSRTTTFPSGTREIVALFQHDGVAPGVDLVSQWSLDGEVVLRNLFQFEPGAEQEGCFSSSVYLDRGLPDGGYRVELFLGPTLRPVASATTAVGQATGPAAASLGGRVVNVDSGQPVSNAVVFFLTPGTDPEAWYVAPTEDRIVGYAATAADGRFRIGGLTPGTSYPALVVCEGYLPTTGVVGPVGTGDGTLTADVPLMPVGP